jgi:transposase
MTQGSTPTTQGIFNVGRGYCERTLPGRSIYRLLYEHGDDLFPDEFFADLYSRRGRHSVPPRILATVMVLQRLEGLSDREAAERLAFDLRWKFACGGLDADYPSFVHTVLVNMRARLRKSDSPTRIFEAVLDVAKEAGVVGTRRVLDSTPLYDAVATQDTVTLLRGGIRGVLRSCKSATKQRVRAVLKRDDRYDTPGKPACDWDDAEAREALVDALARDGYAILALFDGDELSGELGESVRLLATLLGQDLEEGDDGTFRIARRVCRDRVISTVDPEARHGHKTSSRKFDGYKGHVAVDPDSEIVTATAVTPGNVGDGEVVAELIDDLLDTSAGHDEPTDESDSSAKVADLESQPAARHQEPAGKADESSPMRTSSAEPEQTPTPALPVSDAAEEPERGYGYWANLALKAMCWGASLIPGRWFFKDGWTMVDEPVRTLPASTDRSPPDEPAPAAVFGDASYGGASVLAMLDDAGIEVYTKVQPPSSQGGRYAQDMFLIDLGAKTVTCPAGTTVVLRVRSDGSGRAAFGQNCTNCSCRERCTTAKAGRTVNVHAEFERLDGHRRAQRAPAWQEAYKATRPKVERKLGHMMQRRHGGRRARVRGRLRVGHDFSLLAAAVNLARLATLGITLDSNGWGLQPS